MSDKFEEIAEKATSQIDWMSGAWKGGLSNNRTCVRKLAFDFILQAIKLSHKESDAEIERLKGQFDLAYRDVKVQRANALRAQEDTNRLLEAACWLDEFVEEPEYFPGDGDRAWWIERRQAIRELGSPSVPRELCRHGNDIHKCGACGEIGILRAQVESMREALTLYKNNQG